MVRSTGQGKGGGKLVVGTAGDDVLKGGHGGDTLVGYAGDDVMTGGAGADRFMPGSGYDVITDFQHGVDVLELEYTGSPWAYSAADVNGDGIYDTVITSGDDHTVVLLGQGSDALI